MSLGSFGNNIISKYYNALSKRVEYQRSSCMCGDRNLKYYELIPLVSYLFIKGHCSKCENRISLRYPIVEVISGLLATICYLKFGLTYQFIIYYSIFYIMWIIAVIDFYSLIIPNTLLLILLFFSVLNLFIIQTDYFTNIIVAVCVAAVFTFINYLFQKYKSIQAIGFGDVKYIGILFLFVAFPISLFGLWFSAFLAIPGFYFLKQNNSIFNKETKIPFGSFLSIGFIITSLMDNLIINTYYKIIIGY